MCDGEEGANYYDDDIIDLGVASQLALAVKVSWYADEH